MSHDSDILKFREYATLNELKYNNAYILTIPTGLHVK
jgi:hypothetical protein